MEAGDGCRSASAGPLRGPVVLGWVGAGCATAKASTKGRVEEREMLGRPLCKGAS